MVTVKSTKGVGVHAGINVLLYGRAGIGKTMSLSHCPDPIILSAEGGLLSLQAHDLPYIQIESTSDLRDAYKWLRDSADGKGYRTICIDSISEVCDLAFEECKRRVGTEPAKLYPELRASVLPILSAFRALPKHFVATARETTKQLKREQLTGPAVVGNKLTDDLPYVFDIVLHYTLDSDDHRIVYTNSDKGSIAKDRTGLLPPEIKDTEAVLGIIINTILGETND